MTKKSVKTAAKNTKKSAKKITSARSTPRSKHKPFATFQTKLAGGDWLIGTFCEENKQACYFLAEPTADGKFVVSVLERAGTSTSSLKGFPCIIQNVLDDKLVDKIEERVAEYAGDTFPVDAELHAVEDVLGTVALSEPAAGGKSHQSTHTTGDSFEPLLGPVTSRAKFRNASLDTLEQVRKAEALDNNPLRSMAKNLRLW